MKKNLSLIAILLIASLALAGCGSPNEVTTADGAGFWNGLWDGFTAPFAFIGSLFGGDWNVYEVHNTGNWYNFGFLLGISCIMGGTGASTSRS